MFNFSNLSKLKDNFIFIELTSSGRTAVGVCLALPLKQILVCQLGKYLSALGCAVVKTGQVSVCTTIPEVLFPAL